MYKSECVIISVRVCVFVWWCAREYEATGMLTNNERLGFLLGNNNRRHSY